MSKILLEFGADPNLHISYDVRSSLDENIAWQKILSDCIETRGVIPISASAAFVNEPEVVRALLEAGADPDLQYGKDRKLGESILLLNVPLIPQCRLYSTHRALRRTFPRFGKTSYRGWGTGQLHTGARRRTNVLGGLLQQSRIDSIHARSRGRR
jgi:hypothetical protein